jgi:hypothetical protein
MCFLCRLRRGGQALQAQAKQPKIGQIVDERWRRSSGKTPNCLKGILPKVYGQQKLDPIAWGADRQHRQRQLGEGSRRNRMGS